jgi:hypothetical protein
LTTRGPVPLGKPPISHHSVRYRIHKILPHECSPQQPTIRLRAPLGLHSGLFLRPVHCHVCCCLHLPDVSTAARLEGNATAARARAVTGLGPRPPAAGLRRRGATVHHKTAGQVGLRSGMSILALVPVVAVPYWVQLKQTHVHCKAKLSYCNNNDVNISLY